MQDLPSDDRAFSSPSQAQKKLPSVFSQTSVHPPLSTVHSLISTQTDAGLFHPLCMRSNHGDGSKRSRYTRAEYHSLFSPSAARWRFIKFSKPAAACAVYRWAIMNAGTHGHVGGPDLRDGSHYACLRVHTRAYARCRPWEKSGLETICCCVIVINRWFDDARVCRGFF